MAGGNQKRKEAILKKEIEQVGGHCDGDEDDDSDHHDDNYDHNESLQLRREKKVDREKMSITCKDLADYVKEQSAVGL